MVQEILNKCTIDGLTVKLPPTQLDRDIYKQVADKLKKIGGKWVGGKTQAFVFPHDPTELLERIKEGEKVNLKKDFQFFETPNSLAKRLLLFADIEPHHTVLEPSDGYGAIIERINRGNRVNYYEINELCLDKLSAFHNAFHCGSDFLSADETLKYKRIVANPPFSKNQDVDHIKKMYSVLADGGRMVSIASRHWMNSKCRKEKAFAYWLDDVAAGIYEVEAGAFKECGTDIPTVIIVINK